MRAAERIEAADIGAADWAILGVLSVVWGGSFLFYRVLAFQLPPITTVFARCAIGGAALAAFVLWRGQAPLPPRRLWPRFLLLGLIANVLPFTAFAWGESRVSGGTAAILNAMTPVFTMLVSSLLLRTEALTAARIAGIGCGVAGVAVLVGPQALLGQDLLGQAACLGAALCYGFAAPYARSFKGVPPPQMATGQLAAASAILLPLALAVDRPWSLAAPALSGWACLLGLALPSTGFAYLLFFRLLARIGATNLVLVTFLVPVSALLLDAAVLGERVTWNAAAGMAVIACGLGLLDGRLIARLRTRRAAV